MPLHNTVHCRRITDVFVACIHSDWSIEIVSGEEVRGDDVILPADWRSSTGDGADGGRGGGQRGDWSAGGHARTERGVG